MATRLNKSTRNALTRFAYNKATIDKALSKELDRTRKVVEKLVIAGVKKEYPASEIRVLKKHGLTRKDRCFNIVTSEGTSNIVNFRVSKEMDVPCRQHCSYMGSRALWLGQETALAVIDWENAKEAVDEATDQLKADFHSLIETAKTFEELCKAWEPFTEASHLFNSGTLVVMNEEVVDRINSYEKAS